MKSIINKILKGIQARSFKFLSEVLYYLPLFFLCLGQSPNFTEAGINRAFITSPLLLAIFFGTIKQSINSEKGIKHPVLLIGFIALALLIYLNLSFLPVLYFIGVSIIIVFTALKANSHLGEFLLSASLFTAAYMSINGFDFSQLWQFKFISIMLIGGLYSTSFVSKSRGRWDFLLFIAGFALWTVYAGTYSYLWGLPLAFLLRILVQLARPERAIRTDTITGVLLAGYYIYYFLYANHVIQALTGGL